MSCGSSLVAPSVVSTVTTPTFVATANGVLAPRVPVATVGTVGTIGTLGAVSTVGYSAYNYNLVTGANVLPGTGLVPFNNFSLYGHPGFAGYPSGLPRCPIDQRCISGSVTVNVADNASACMCLP